MNEASWSLLDKVIQRVQRSITDRQCPATVALEGTRTLMMSDYDYLRDDETAAAFEHRVAEKAKDINAVRWIIAVPQIWLITGNKIHARPVSNHPLNQGEEEAITWMSYDHHDGIDYGRVPYTRRPNGQPVYDEPEIITAAVTPSPTTPGQTLLRAFTEIDPTE